MYILACLFYELKMSSTTTGQKTCLRKADWREVVGPLCDLEADEDSVCLRLGDKVLRIPNDESIRERLRELIGKRIGVLTTDLPERPVLIRLLSMDNVSFTRSSKETESRVAEL